MGIEVLACNDDNADQHIAERSNLLLQSMAMIPKQPCLSDESKRASCCMSHLLLGSAQHQAT